MDPYLKSSKSTYSHRVAVISHYHIEIGINTNEKIKEEYGRSEKGFYVLSDLTLDLPDSTYYYKIIKIGNAAAQCN